MKAHFSLVRQLASRAQKWHLNPLTIPRINMNSLLLTSTGGLLIIAMLSCSSASMTVTGMGGSGADGFTAGTGGAITGMGGAGTSDAGTGGTNTGGAVGQGTGGEQGSGTGGSTSSSTGGVPMGGGGANPGSGGTAGNGGIAGAIGGRGGASSSLMDCAGGKYDPSTNLCWQDPPSDSQFNLTSATTYCAGLNSSGAGGWRVPTYTEVLSLRRGTEGCVVICSSGLGPGMNGCYWPPDLRGTCGVYLSSTTRTDPTLGPCVRAFAFTGAFGADQCGVVDNISDHLRCVRTGP